MANNNEEQEEAAAAAFPHNYKNILENFGASIDTSSPEKARSGLRRPGVFDQQQKETQLKGRNKQGVQQKKTGVRKSLSFKYIKRYWVDEKGNNCFMVYARALTITFGDESLYWRWHTVKAAGNVPVDVAEMLDVCSLKVHGTFETGYLTPGTEYEVSYVISLKEPKYGWEDQVDFSLTVPRNAPKDRKCDLRTLPKGRWSCFRVGVFTLERGQSGPMEFTLRQSGKWKKGLLVLGVDISPK